VGEDTHQSDVGGVCTAHNQKIKRQLYITPLYQLDSQHYRKSVRRWSKTQAAAIADPEVRMPQSGLLTNGVNIWAFGYCSSFAATPLGEFEMHPQPPFAGLFKNRYLSLN
jgi:hypothetical protein